MHDDLLQRADDAVRAARAAGAQDAVASAGWGRNIEYQYRDAKLEKVQESTSRSVSLRVYVDGRFAAFSTNDLERERLTAFIDDAVALTRALEPDPFRAITPPELYEGVADVDLDLVDTGLTPEHEAWTRDDRIAICERLYQRAHADDAVISATSSVSDGYSVSARVASNGFARSAERSSVWFGAECTIEDSGKRPEAHRFAGGLHRGGLPDPETVGAECLARALARRGQKKGPSKKTVLYVENEAATSLLGRIFSALSAGAVQQKQSFFAGKLGQQVASPLLTLLDDPLVPRGLGSRLWDGEGIASRRRSVIEDGVLKSFYVDTYYGRKLGWTPTSGGASNVLVALGDTDRDGLFTRHGDGVLVNSWLGGNASGTTGDFSFGLRGHLVSGGVLGEPVSEMNVTGNYLELLQRLVGLGNDPAPYSPFRCPTLVFDGIELSGA